MLLSRFWFLLLSVMAIMGLSTALLARGMINRGAATDVDEALARDRFSLELLMKLDARARIDALGPIAADGAVRDAVRNRKADSKLKDRLRTLNQQLEEMRADLLIAVDGSGEILAQEGKRPAKQGASLGAIPLVEHALSGYLGDDVWVYDGSVYRVAARPVIDRGSYVGALVHAQKLDATLAQRLSERLSGPTVAFFFRDAIIASYTPTDVIGAPTQAEVLAPLGEALNDEHLRRGERTEPYDIEDRGRVSYSLVAGSASSASVGYALARGYSTLPTPFAIFDQSTKEDIDALPKGLLAGGLILMFALAMGIMYLERDRPLGILRNEVEKMARGQSDELNLPKLSSAYRKVGENIHAALDRLLEKGGARRGPQKANLEGLLGPAEELRSSAFSFGGGPVTEESVAAQPPKMPPPHAMPAPQAAPGPQPMPPPHAMPAPMPMPAPKPMAAPQVATMAGTQTNDEQHFREVSDQYVVVRSDCGESTADLTFDKFATTLRKNRDQIIGTRPDLVSVRFSVYVKDGKAAIKANPLKA